MQIQLLVYILLIYLLICGVEIMSKDLKELIKNKKLTQEQKDEILLTAAREGNLEIIREAIEKLGASVNATTRGGHTPLIVAANRGHVKVIEELYVNYGADVNAVANDGWTALRYVTQFGGNLKVVRALLNCKDIDVSITDKNNRAPILIALRNGRSEISKLLIEHPSNKMSQEQKDEILLTAAEKGNLEITRKAVELGADVNAKNKDGKTALDIAIKDGNEETVTLLESAQRAGKSQKRKTEVEEVDVDAKRARVERATEKVAEKAAKPSKRKMDVKGEETVVTSKKARLKEVQVKEAQVTKILGGLSLK